MTTVYQELMTKNFHSTLNGKETSVLDFLAICPLEFKTKKTPWHEYAEKILVHTNKESFLNKEKWQWKFSSIGVREKQLVYLGDVLWTQSIIVSDEEKVIIVAWLLSEMLLEVPVS